MSNLQGLSGKFAVKHIEIQIIHVEQSGELVQSHFVRAISSVIMIFEVMQLYSVNLRAGLLPLNYHVVPPLLLTETPVELLQLCDC